MNHMIKVLPDGRHQVYSVLMGHYTLPVGPKWETPRQAVDYANAVDTVPTTSPLRESPAHRRGNNRPLARKRWGNPARARKGERPTSEGPGT